MRSDRISGAIGLCAALLMGAGEPAAATPGAAWISLCTASGGEIRLLVGKDGHPADDYGSSGACHATCPLPRKAAAKAGAADGA